jgi:hypothetical protein
MNLKFKIILMVIVAFIIGWFLRTMIMGSSLGTVSIVKAVGGKHGVLFPTVFTDNDSEEEDKCDEKKVDFNNNKDCDTSCNDIHTTNVGKTYCVPKCLTKIYNNETDDNETDDNETDDKPPLDYIVEVNNYLVGENGELEIPQQCLCNITKNPGSNWTPEDWGCPAGVKFPEFAIDDIPEVLKIENYILEKKKKEKK